MFRSSDIRRFLLFIPREKRLPLLEELGRGGLVQLDVPRDSEKGAFGSGGEVVSPRDLDRVEGEATSLIEKLKEMTSAGDKPFGGRGAPLRPVTDTAGAMKKLEEISRKTAQYEGVTGEIAARLERLTAEEDECRRAFECAGEISLVAEEAFLSFLYGAVADEKLAEAGAGMEDLPVFGISHNGRVLLVVPLSLREKVRRHIEGHGYTDKTPWFYGILRRGGAAAVREGLLVRRRELERRRQCVEAAFKKLCREWLPELNAMAAGAGVTAAFAREAEKTLQGEALTLFVGWLPLQSYNEVTAALERVCGGVSYLHVFSRKEMRPWRGRVPVLLKNTSPLRPFERLVTVMGFPETGEVDPTPLAALAYMIMFGVMFGDVGQGLVLAAAGTMIRFFAKDKKSTAADIGVIMVYCGFTAAFFGLLYGSVFSNEHLIAPLLFSPMHRMGDLFFGAIGMGAVLIVLGMAFGIVNRLSGGNVLDAVFHFHGMAGLLLYLVFIYVAAGLVFEYTIDHLAGYAALGALVMIFFRPLLFRVIPGHEDPLENGVFAWVVELIVEIIETASSFVGNTISFVRAGAFALSHAGLSIAVYTLAGIVDGTFATAAVIVIGNIFIICLEGLVCSIQAMRLEYYEFFSRFYSGKGEPFVPFTLPELKGEERLWVVSG